jgi:hypothetical protein
MDQGFSLGGLVPEPAAFQPTDIFTDRHYIYKVDWQLNVCKRTPLFWNMNEPSGYFEILNGPAPVPADEEPLFDETFIEPEQKKRRGFGKKR